MMTFFVIEKCGDRIFLLVQEQLTLTRSEEETNESFKAKTEIAEMEQHIPKGIEANYFEVEKAKDGGEDVTAKAGGEKGKMSILNTIEKSAESKDYHLKNEKAEDKEEKFSLGSKIVYDDLTKVSKVLGISIKLTRLIMDNRTYTDGRNLKTKVLKAMTKSTRFKKKDIEDWDKMDATIKAWYNNKKGVIKYT